MSGVLAQRIVQLRRTVLFAGLDEETLAFLAHDAREQHYARGEPVVRKGDRPISLILVLAGKLKEACQSSEGDERIVDVLMPNQTCGEAALLLGEVYPTFVTALVHAQLLHIERRAVLAVLGREPRLVRRLLRRLSERIVEVVHDLDMTTRLTPLQRVARYLRARWAPVRPVVVLPVTKGVLASRLGMTQEAFSRVLRDLSEAGVIEVRGSRIHVADPARLNELSG